MIAMTLLAPSISAAQTKTPNYGASAFLRRWPVIGSWQTVLVRRDDQSLACGLLSGRVDAGRLVYLVGLRQMPEDLSLTIVDADWSALTGDQISLVIDGVRVGGYPITKRVNDKGVYRTIVATVPKAEWQRIFNLFRTGENVSYITASSTFTFPLNGAAASLVNMRDCMSEAANLQPN